MYSSGNKRFIGGVVTGLPKAHGVRCAGNGCGNVSIPGHGTPTSPARSRRITLKDVLFDPNKYNIRPDAEPVLRETAQVLKESPNINVLIEGYADIKGEEQYNQRLAARRADAAKEYLVRLGIDPKRISTLAMGASTKFSTGSSEEDFQLNRRAHFV